MRAKTCLTLDDANTIVAAAKAAASAQGLAVAIVVTDEAGFPLHMERMDGAPLQSPEIGLLKARTAALTRIPTKTFEDITKTRNGFLKMPDVLPLQGGVPILVKGECVGAVAASGVQAHQDEEIARAGLAALGIA